MIISLERYHSQGVLKVCECEMQEALEDSKDMQYIRAVQAKVTPSVENPSRSRMNQKLDRPRRSERRGMRLAGWIRVGDVDAFTLFDSGSNTDALSTGFAQVSNTLTQKLEYHDPLQLGTFGSRAAINYGVQVLVELGDTQCPEYYVDIVNIDHYDCIAGAPMTRQFGIRPDFRMLKNGSCLPHSLTRRRPPCEGDNQPRLGRHEPAVGGSCPNATNVSYLERADAAHNTYTPPPPPPTIQNPAPTELGDTLFPAAHPAPTVSRRPAFVEIEDTDWSCTSRRTGCLPRIQRFSGPLSSFLRGVVIVVTSS